ncbi:hypothetical protein PG994_015352 [Apiospora phragmitis]|uniref:Uncharacterized protein n=1 Tax=Apiospora phragmitis TaxID=2905665 RepID=A0ABR1SRA5_9PEZI
MQDPFVDNDEEEFRYALDKSIPSRGRGFGSLCQLTSETDDFGEEFVAHVSAFQRSGRRLSRWEAPEYSTRGAVRPFRVQRAHNGSTPDMNGDYPEGSERAEFGEKGGKSRTNGTANFDVTMEDAEDLDDMDKELLGLASGAEEGDGGKDDDDDEELDDVDKTLLGLADDDSDSEC